MLTITLNDAEQRIARWVGTQRQAANDASHVPDARRADASSADVHINGFGAELAFCKLFNVYPDFDIQPRRGGADCSRFGEAVDVKATTYQDGRLLALPHKTALAADVYALLVVAWPEFRFVGFARAAELFVPERLTNLGRGPTYAMQQSLLHEHQ